MGAKSTSSNPEVDAAGDERATEPHSNPNSNRNPKPDWKPAKFLPLGIALAL